MASRPARRVVMGSSTDWPTMQAAVDVLDRFGVAHEATGRQRPPHARRDVRLRRGGRGRGLRAIIAGAGGAAHLPGMLAAKTTVPVLGVPVPSRHLQGQDSLYSIVQMPAGIPVATFAIGEAGATNAALFAVAMLAAGDPDLPAALAAYRAERRDDQRRRSSTLPPPASDRAVSADRPAGDDRRCSAAASSAATRVVAARLMGYGTIVLDPDPGAPAGRVADEHLVAAYDDPPRSTASRARARSSRPSSRTRRRRALERLPPTSSWRRRRRPSPIAQDRIAEKAFLAGDRARRRPVSPSAGRRRRRRRAFPAILKTARLGYDGKGQRAVGDRRAAPRPWRELGVRRASSSSGCRSTSS